MSLDTKTYARQDKPLHSLLEKNQERGMWDTKEENELSSKYTTKERPGHYYI